MSISAILIQVKPISARDILFRPIEISSRYVDVGYVDTGYIEGE
jgi:hypothetical protein